VEICTVGSVRGESVGAAMVDLHGHEAGNGGYSQGRPTARRFSSTRRDVRFAGLPGVDRFSGSWKKALPVCRFAASSAHLGSWDSFRCTLALADGLEKMQEEEWIKNLEDGMKVKFTYLKLSEYGAFITAQIAGNEVVYSVVLTHAKNPLSHEDVEGHFAGELAKKLDRWPM
jgi:hypothetical protein